MPVAEVNLADVKLSSPAMRMPDGLIAAGADYPAIRAALKAAAGLPPGYAEANLDRAREGFITASGTFVSRSAALSLAVWCGQLERGKSTSPDMLTPGDLVEYAEFLGGSGEGKKP